LKHFFEVFKSVTFCCDRRADLSVIGLLT